MSREIDGTEQKGISTVARGLFPRGRPPDNETSHMLDIFNAIAPVFLLIIAGVIVEYVEVLPREFNRLFSTFIVTFCVPCLTFHIIVNVRAEQLTQGWWWLCVCAAQLLVAALLFIIEKARRAPLLEATVISLGGALCNSAFLGLPVIMNYLPGNAEATMLAGLMLLSGNVLMIPMFVIMDTAGAAPGPRPKGVLAGLWSALRRYVFRSPILMTALISAAINALGIPIWAPFDRTMADIGFLAPTCMLFSLGLGLREKVARILKGHRVSMARQAWLLAWKLVLQPLILLGMLTAAGFTGLWVAVPVIIIASGSAVFISVLADLHDACPEEATFAVVSSSTLCLATMTGWIWVLQELGYLS